MAGLLICENFNDSMWGVFHNGSHAGMIFEKKDHKVQSNVCFQFTRVRLVRYERIIGNKVTPSACFIAKATILPNFCSHSLCDTIPELDSVDISTDMSDGKIIGNGK